MNFVSEDCYFWPGPDCYKQNIPVWPGAKIEYDNQYSYNFYPDNGDTIQFNFTPVAGDSKVFYIDTVQKFTITFEYQDTVTILGYSDSARFYVINHYDLSGNIINSQLNGQQIIICKNLGLVRFFLINEFPEVLAPIALIGQGNQNIGLYNITAGMIYDFQPGDEIQHKIINYYSYAPPSWNWIKYDKQTILSREETNDLLTYQIEELIFYEDSSIVSTQVITQSFNKQEVIAQLPYEKFEGDYQSFFLDDYCDLKLWTYKFDAENSLAYCDIDNVWGNIDTQGPPDVEDKIWVFGLGIKHWYILTNYGDLWNYHSYQDGIVYFKKGDVICGNLVVSIPNSESDIELYPVFPNPFNDWLYFKNLNDSKFNRIEIRNSLGQVFRIEDNIHSSLFSMNVADLIPGVYFYMIINDKGAIKQGKLIKK